MSRSSPLLAALLAAGVALSGCPDSNKGTAPTADAGPGGHVPKRALVMLDGTGSRVAAGQTRPLTYAWRQTAGEAVVLSDPSAATPTFVTPGVSGPVTFELVVTGNRPSLPSSVTFVVDNQRPSASAGPDLSVRAGWLATVSAVASWDADGDPLTYTWLQTAGPPVVLDSPAPGLGRFTVPEVQGVLSFVVVVSDGEATAEDEVSVRAYPPGANFPPVAEAGPDQSARSGTYVALQGYGSDPDGFPVMMSWAQRSGPAVVLQNSGTGFAGFLAPPGDAELEFELTVSDGVDSATDTTTVHVGAPAPEIDSLAITPAHPRTNDDLTAVVVARLPGGTGLPALAYAWTRNGAAVPGQTGATFPASLTAKADVVAVKVTASDGVHQTTATVSATIEDSPPEPRLSVPAEVAFGATLAGEVTLVDPDGDPVAPSSLSLAFGPAGMSLSAGGALTWTPTLPMFDRTLEVHYGVSAGGGPARPGTIRVVDPAREQALRRAGIEIAANAEAMRARDLDGDGRDELLVAGLSGVYELRASGTGYAIAWMAPFRDGTERSGGWGSAAAVEALDLDGDGFAELFYGWSGSLVRLDGKTRRETGRVALGDTEELRACEVADVDRDGRPELACLTGTDSYESTGRLLVFDPATLEQEMATAPLKLGASLAVGDVDGDAALELVTAGGYVFDGATHANQWAYGPGFGSFVEIGKLEQGGAPVIVGGMPLRGYSATLKSPLWEATSVGAVPFLLRDADGDGAAEIVALSSWPSALQALDYVGGSAVLAPAWSANPGNFSFGTRALAAGDLDGDGAAEIVWDDGAAHTGEDSLVVAGPLSAQAAIEWHNLDPSQLDGPMLGGQLARTGAGQTRLVFQSVGTNSGYDGTRLVLLDPATGLVSTSPEIGSNWADGGGIALADYDGDGVDEVFVGTASYYDGYFAAWDPATAAVTWTAPQAASSSGAPAAVRAADLNGDGHPDLVGLTSGGVVWVHDVRNQTLVWKSVTLGSATALEVVELDGAAPPEIVVGAGGRLVAFRWSAAAGIFLEAASVALPGVSDLAAGDCDGDGSPEVYALTGSSYGYDPTAVVAFDASLVKRGEFSAPLASSLFVEDLGPGRKNLVVSTPVAQGSYVYGGEPYLLVALDPVQGAEIWRSPLVWGAVPRDSAAWLELDGRWRIAFGTGRSMMLTR